MMTRRAAFIGWRQNAEISKTAAAHHRDEVLMPEFHYQLRVTTECRGFQAFMSLIYGLRPLCLGDSSLSGLDRASSRGIGLNMSVSLARRQYQ